MADGTQIEETNERANDILSLRPTTEQVFIPPVPHVPIPEGLATRMPELRQWYDEFHDELDKWRVQTAHMLSNKD